MVRELLKVTEPSYCLSVGGAILTLLVPGSTNGFDDDMAAYKVITDVQLKFLNCLRTSFASDKIGGVAQPVGRALLPVVTSLTGKSARPTTVDKSLLIGVSGGADSVALLRGACWLREELHISPIAVHVNHQLRGAESDQDAEWVRELCQQLHVPSEIVVIDVAKLAAIQSIGIEEAARDARYDALRETAERLSVPVVALAHNADDQIETALHHLLRGTGLAGLKGMPSSRSLSDRVHIIRPLLSIRRAEIEQFLLSLGQCFRSDSSNLDTSLTRNFLRHELLPLLEQRLNPQVREHLLRLTQQAGEWHDILQQQAARLLDAALLNETSPIVRLRCEPFADQPRPLVREAFVVLWTRLAWPRKAMTFAHWNALAEMAQNGGTKSLNLPGNRTCLRRGGLLAIECRRTRDTFCNQT